MNIMIAVFTLLIGAVSPVEDLVHDFHLSKCDIVYDADDGALQISLQMFIDDLELALGARGFEGLGICTPKETEGAESIIHEYILDHLSLQVDGSPLELSWVGKEVSDDLAGIWCYLDVYTEKPSKSIDVYNDLLIEVFEDQRNIVKLNYTTDQKAYFLFDRKETEGTLNLSN